jgi:hypothetical protein
MFCGGRRSRFGHLLPNEADNRVDGMHLTVAVGVRATLCFGGYFRSSRWIAKLTPTGRQPPIRELQEVIKEVVGIHVLPSRSFFGDGILRMLLRLVSLANSTSAPSRF